MALKPVVYNESLTGQTASGQSSTAADVSGYEDFVAELIVASGSGMLEVIFEDSSDGITWGLWFSLGGVGGPGTYTRAPSRPPLGHVRRAQTIVGGTWAYTLRLVAEARR